MQDHELADEISKARALITIAELAVDNRSFDVANPSMIFGLSMILGDARVALDSLDREAQSRARVASAQ